MSDEPIMDWGSDMAACLAYIKEHPCPAALASAEVAKAPKERDDGRTMDRMFDRTRYEQSSCDAYQRLLDQGHRA